MESYEQQVAAEAVEDELNALKAKMGKKSAKKADTKKSG